MIGSLGVPELLFILVLALLIFGPRKLPEIGRTLGRALGEFRRATSDLKQTLDAEMSASEFEKSAPAKPKESPKPSLEAAPAAPPAAGETSSAVDEENSTTASASDEPREST